MIVSLCSLQLIYAKYITASLDIPLKIKPPSACVIKCGISLSARSDGGCINEEMQYKCATQPKHN